MYIYINAHRYVSKQCLASQVLICRCSFITHNILLSFFSLSIFVIINLRRRRRKISNSVAYENYRMLQLMYHDATRRSDSIDSHTDKRDDREIDSYDYIHLLNWKGFIDYSSLYGVYVLLWCVCSSTVKRNNNTIRRRTRVREKEQIDVYHHFLPIFLLALSSPPLPPSLALCLSFSKC